MRAHTHRQAGKNTQHNTHTYTHTYTHTHTHTLTHTHTHTHTQEDKYHFTSIQLLPDDAISNML